MGNCWEKGEDHAWSLLFFWLSLLVLTARFHDSVTPMVSLQSQIFLGVLTWAIEAALIVFSRLPLGASCSPAPVILPSMYCRVSETRLKSCLTIFRQQPSAVSQWPEVSPGGCPRDAAHPTQTTWQCTCRYIRMYLAVPNPLQRHSIYIKGGGGEGRALGSLRVTRESGEGSLRNGERIR